ncbi:protein NLP1-like [Zingiber officinale]|uniref:Uncharacterized protein n=1 Tax=Zingiber officinale TaxID=94328 RepID=A0A8J5GAQ6_ZINOF|nr:protein NLP1-like [Zingiber officinale]XP_042392898.1 protein NLP1-like [Zingiber officinale]KAG6502880.1 hypothetical protein ZIOFF_035169 [Zingiber officinale]
MEAVPQPERSPRNSLSGGAADLDSLDQLLSGDGWLEFHDGFPADSPNSMSPFNSLSFSPLFEVNNDSPNPLENCDRENMGRPGDETLPGDVDILHLVDPNSIGQCIRTVFTSELRSASPSSELGTSRWIQTKDSNFYVKEKLLQALDHIKETHRDGEVLIQLWVPMKRGDRLVLTTYSQPFTLTSNSEKLVNYREVSTNYQLSAEENSGEALGLPGRVFVGRLPEWTPDVQYFTSYEYPRVNYAQLFDIRGSVALPVFDHGCQSCLGVVELVMTTRKINYTFELENICNALQEVELSSSAAVTVPQLKVISNSYQAALSEILEVLKTISVMHMLPLAQTWVPCIQQGKKGIRHSDENYRECVSTVGSSCYVNDPSMMGFYEACSEHHLLKGQGVAGMAFTTNQPCFLPDVSALSKTEYPLAHHAKIFGLKSAVAIRLRSILTGSSDFVLEFFLPPNCILIEEQKLMLDSLSRTMQHVCQNLRVITAKELADEATLQLDRALPSDFLLDNSSSEGEPGKQCAAVTSIEAQTMDVSSDITPLSISTEESSKEKTGPVFYFKDEVERFDSVSGMDEAEVISPAQKKSSKLRQHPVGWENKDSDNEDSLNFYSICSDATKTTEKKHRKAQKTVSLEVLRKYFAGSLKDAAKSIGVCPTTLKRICRQHGLARWPSRKIKKVDHSLRKLQVVIDSVHGTDKAIQLSSLYTDFTTASVSEKNSLGEFQDKNSMGGFPVSKSIQNDHLHSDQDIDAITSHHHSSSSHSSSSSQTSILCSTPHGEKHCLQIAGEGNLEEKVSDNQGAKSQMTLHLSTKSTWSCPRFQNHKSSGEHCSSGSLSPPGDPKSSWMIVKAAYGAEKVRIRLDPNWSFEELRDEILKRFDISIKNSVNFKYLDDESELVLLTCDADLQECIHIYRSSDTRTIKISVQPVVTPIMASS